MSTDLHGRTNRSTSSNEDDPEHRTRTTESNPEPPAKTGLSGAQVVGGALAAMTAAALGSRLSVAGTVVGAALASVVAAVAGSLYTTSLKRTHRHVAAAWQGRRQSAGPATPGSATEEPETPAKPGSSHSASAGHLRRISTRTVVVGAAAMFVVAALALTGVELLTGHALSGGSGTTVSQVTDRRETAPTGPSDPSPAAASSTAARTSEPTAAPSSPTTEPSASSTPTATATPSASPTPSASASDSPTPTPGPDEPSVARTS